MAAVTRAQLVALAREYMDAVGSSRWSDDTIKATLNSAFDEEWSNILNAAPYFRFQEVTLTTNASGQLAYAALSTGGGDSQRNWYRIISLTDGNVSYRQTDFASMPLATKANVQGTLVRAYYLTGDVVQVLPPAQGTTIYVAVNYKPTALSDLLSDASVIDFPANNESLIAANAVSKLLLKGGAEVGAANNWRTVANEDRATLLDDIRRRTINPTRMAYPDSASDWSA